MYIQQSNQKLRQQNGGYQYNQYQQNNMRQQQHSQPRPKETKQFQIKQRSQQTLSTTTTMNVNNINSQQQSEQPSNRLNNKKKRRRRDQYNNNKLLSPITNQQEYPQVRQQIRQTKVIMVKAVQNTNHKQSLEQQQQRESNNNNTKLSIKKQSQKQSRYNNVKKVAIHNLQSPILFRFSDDSDSDNDNKNGDDQNNYQKNDYKSNDDSNNNNDDKKEYSVAQSSRRRFKQQSSQQQEYQQQQQQYQQQQQKQQQQNHHHLQKQHQSNQVVILKSTSFQTLINAPIPQNNFINCIIKRNRHLSNNNNKFLNLQTTVVYQMFLLEDKKFLMSCVKNRLVNLTTSRYQFYKQRKVGGGQNNNNNNNYSKENLYAIMTSNFTGTEYVLRTVVKNDTISERSTAIDKSDMLIIDQSTTAIGSSLSSPKKGKVKQFTKGQKNKYRKYSQTNQTKQELKQACFISFKANLFNLGGQRQVKLIKKKNKKITKTDKFSDIKQAYQNKQKDKIQQLHNKKAMKGKNGLQLDLKNLATMQSSKNIILQTSQQSKQALIFGKIKQDIYSISIGYPLSIVEGLAFGIANLDRKFFVN